MTVIAWDGRTLAADRESGSSFTKFGTAMKIGRAPDGGLWGCAGSAGLNRELVTRFMAGAVVDDFPQAQRDKDEHSSLLWITKDGAARLFQRSPYPIELANEIYATGAGSEAAMAVMLCGLDARKAVQIASQVCQGCGNGLDALELN